MATCRDCIHEKVCNTLCPRGLLPYQSLDYPAEVFCKEFKDESQYAEVKHGEWELYADNEDGYNHHRCSVCKEDAIFTYIEEPDYDEGLDGEWYYICDIEVGIKEMFTNYCPHCGAKMDGGNNGSL